MRSKFTPTILFVLLLAPWLTSCSPKDGIIRPAELQHVRKLFSLSDVRVTDPQMLSLQELDHEYLKSLEVDRLLSLFRKEAGLSQQGFEPYPYWESEDVWGGGPLAGHIMGFWLSSMAMMYQSTGDPEIYPLVEKALKGLKECQEADGEGFVGAQPGVKGVFAEVAKGNFTTTNPLINKMWEPVYVMNKLMLGLYDVYNTFGAPLAKEILVDLGDWFGTHVIDKLDHEKMQELLVCEHGSINESYVDIYSLTGEDRFLSWAGRLNDEDMWVPAAEGKDILNGWHANTQIPKFTGFERIYTYTGNEDFRRAARFFWHTVVSKHTWVNGGNSTGEHFFPIDQFEKRVEGSGGPESCNSVNMMRLTEALYQDDGDMEYIDYYERVLLNHIVANYDPEQGMCAYFTPVRPASIKNYSSKYDSFWCCTGTGMQAPAKFGKMIYSAAGDTLFVNMFISSDLQWKDEKVSLTMETAFPADNKVKLAIAPERGKSFALAIRHPWWSEDLRVTVNGDEVDVKAVENGGYVTVERKWKKGDEVAIELSPSLRTEPVPGGTHYHAFLYGPVLLGTRIEEPSLDPSIFHQPTKVMINKRAEGITSPELTAPAREVVASAERVAGDKKLRFQVPASVATREFSLEPYNGIHFCRYSMYFKDYSEED